MGKWSSSRPAGRASGYVVLSLRVHEEDGFFVGECAELGVSSFGSTLDEAVRMTLDAAEVYLNGLDEVGERERVFAERGVTVYCDEPSAATEVQMTVHPGEVVTSQRLALAR